MATLTGAVAVQPNVSLPKTKKIQRYVALLSQAGTSNPTVIELQNTTGQTITWTRTAAGSYESTLQINGIGRSLLVQNIYTKHAFLNVESGMLTLRTTSQDEITLLDDCLNNTTIQIEIFTTYE